MYRTALSALALSLLAMSTLPSHAATLAVNTSNSGGFTNLDSVVDDVRGTINSSEMVGVTVFHFNYGGGNTSNLIQPGGQAALPSPRQNVLQDFALNNGVINPGAGSALSTGDVITGTVVGLGVHFNSPIKNGNGNDALFFELSVGAAQGPDPVTIALLDASDTVIGNEVTFASGDFGFETNQLDSQVVSIPSGATSLALLNGAVTANGSVVDSYYNLLDLDFSDFGLASGDMVSGLFVRGALIDPTLIAGFATVPEPSSVAMWTLLGLAFVGFGVRKCRRK